MITTNLLRPTVLVLIVVLKAMSPDATHAQSLERQLIATASIVNSTGVLQSEGSLGQPVGSALFGESLLVTQGFHQGELTGEKPALSADRDVYTQVKAWPNPLTSLLNIELADAHKVASIRVFDLSGREQQVSVQAAYAGPPSQRYQLDLEHLAAGSYLILLESPTGKALTRIKVTKLE